MQVGSTVTLAYEGKTADGVLFGRATVDDPMVFQTGRQLTLSGFETKVLGMNKIGEKMSFSIPCELGFGERHDDNMRTMPLVSIPYRDLEIGKQIWIFDGDDSRIPVTVLDIDSESVTFDLNHPLAGKTLFFEVELLDFDDAPEGFILDTENYM